MRGHLLEDSQTFSPWQGYLENCLEYPPKLSVAHDTGHLRGFLPDIFLYLGLSLNEDQASGSAFGCANGGNTIRARSDSINQGFAHVSKICRKRDRKTRVS